MHGFWRDCCGAWHRARAAVARPAGAVVRHIHRTACACPAAVLRGGLLGGALTLPPLPPAPVPAIETPEALLPAGPVGLPWGGYGGFVAVGEPGEPSAPGEPLPVPEPGTLTILGAGVVLLLLVRRRRRTPN